MKPQRATDDTVPPATRCWIISPTSVALDLFPVFPQPATEFACFQDSPHSPPFLFYLCCFLLYLFYFSLQSSPCKCQATLCLSPSPISITMTIHPSSYSELTFLFSATSMSVFGRDNQVPTASGGSH